MHHCIISLAANYDQEKNLTEARLRLNQILSVSYYTRELWTQPEAKCDSTIGATAQPLYLNQLLYAHTTADVLTLQRQLKTIEQLMGRTPADRLQNIVRIDLDLMQYDEQRYHLPDWERSYIRQLVIE